MKQTLQPDGLLQKKASSISHSSEPASKKTWLRGIVAAIALALVWLVWPTQARAEEPQEEANPVPPIHANGHDYVDLGLKDDQGRPIYWATCNVGASNPEDYGLYFAWGETMGYTSGHPFNYANYNLCNGSISTMTKYCTSSEYGTVDYKKVLDLEDDAAHVNWGGDWRMPTKEEQDQLRTKCIWTWNSMMKGYTVKGPNGNSIFLPAAGTRLALRFGFDGSDGYYWSSSLATGDSYGAHYLHFDPGEVRRTDDYRCNGLSVRAVLIPSE